MHCLRSKREKTRCLWSSFVCITFIIWGVFLYISLELTGKYCEKDSRCLRWTSAKGNKCFSPCTSDGCILSANIILSYINDSVDPCEDFYSFSCGQYVDQFGKYDNDTETGRIMNSITSELRELLELTEADDESAVGKMKTVYDSCTKSASSEGQAIPSALQFLREIGIPDWPYLPQGFEFSNLSLATVLGNLAAYNEYAFMKIEIDYGNSTLDETYNIRVLGARSFIEKNEVSLSEYLIHRVLKYFKIDDERSSEMGDEVKKIGSVIRSFDWNSVTKNCSRRNLDKIYVNCSENKEEWINLCHTVKTFIDVANISHLVSEHKVVISCAVSVFLNEVNYAITNVPQRSVADFLSMNFFLSHLEDLSFYFRLTRHNFQDDYEPKVFNRNERCIQWTTQNMVMALAYQYSTKFLTKSALVDVQNFVDQYVSEVTYLILQQSWLTDDIKEYILYKLNHMTTSVSLQIEFYFNKTYVDNYYKQYRPTPKSFLKNILQLQKHYFSSAILEEQSNILHQLKPFTDIVHFDGKLLEIGLLNLRPPLYLHDRPRLINFMYLVPAIGHEICRSIFMDLLFLAHQNQTLAENLLPRVSCFTNQHAKYRIENISENVLENSSLNEIISDNIGMTLLDKLIEKFVTSDNIYSLPALPYSAKQLIYVATLQFWCSRTTKKQDETSHFVNSHIPGNLRVIHMLHNSKQFSKVFNCSTGKYMNPASKCILFNSSGLKVLEN